MSTILCRYCGQSVGELRYNNHLQRCVIFSHYQDGLGDDGDDNILESYIQSNNQLSPGNNINRFLVEHHSPPIRRYIHQTPRTHTRRVHIPMVQRMCFNIEIGIDIDSVSTVVESNCDDICSVCYEHFNDLKEVRMLICGHKFCTTCISKWCEKNTTCPLCKFDLKKKIDTTLI
jgi:hypothetical protein|uniref:RING-type E3 ubiquitin transferase n=1 Tax=viral metagenome TaxID=1070528 RepID=A0A6C0BFX0_9ZZZZ